VIFASRVGFSPALGAFIMGSIIAETTQAEHIEHLVRPVKDLFGAVFFVSVGMLINPNTLVEYWVPVLILTVITIFGQSISSTIGSLISGQPLKQSIQTGMSLSQIGEFSFIIATLGMTLNVTSSFLYPVVVAVSAITTFTTPFMIKFSAPFSDYLVKKLPRKWTKRIERYSANAQSIKSASNWQIVLRAYITQVVIHSVIIIAITLLSTRYFLPLVITTNHGNELAAVITLVVLAPFLWALSLRRVAVKEVQELMLVRRYRGPIIMLVLLRFILALVYIGFLLDNFFSPQVALITLVIAALLYLLFPKKLNAQYSKIESRFFKNLNERESVKNKRQLSGLTPWDGHMTYFDISKESNIAGKTLEELSIREQMGINIAFIKRGEITITVPSRNERLFPGDEICVIGTDIQLKEFKKYLDENEIAKPEEIDEPEIVMRQFELVDEEFMGKSIRQSGLREKTSGLVVGLERRGKRIMNPDSHLVLQKDDILWIVGDRKLLTRLIRSQHS
jgi:CPA2 family monovalent cation:H+ antiporter-2